MVLNLQEKLRGGEGMEQVTGEEGRETGKEGEQEKEGNWVGNKKGRRRKRTERGY